MVSDPDIKVGQDSLWSEYEIRKLQSAIDSNGVLTYRSKSDPTNIYVTKNGEVGLADEDDESIQPILMMYDVLPGVAAAMVARARGKDIPYILSDIDPTEPEYAWEVCATCDQVKSDVFAASTTDTIYAAFCDDSLTEEASLFLAECQGLQA